MDIDWGGQGPANMPSGNNCYALGTISAHKSQVAVTAQAVWVYLVWAQRLLTPWIYHH